MAVLGSGMGRREIGRWSSVRTVCFPVSIPSVMEAEGVRIRCVLEEEGLVLENAAGNGRNCECSSILY